MFAEMECLLKERGLSGAGGREEISKALATHSEVEVKIARESEVLTSWDRVQICIELLEGSGAFGKLKSPSEQKSTCYPPYNKSGAGQRDGLLELDSD